MLQPIDTRQVTLNAQGAGTVVFGPPKYGNLWCVHRIVLSGNSTLQPTGLVYVVPSGATADVIYFITGTATANFDYDEETNPFPVTPGQQLLIGFTGGTVGAMMRASLIVDQISTL